MTCGKDVIESCQLISDPPIAVPFGYWLYENDKEGKFYLLYRVYFQIYLLKSFKKNKREVFSKVEKIINWHQRRRKQNF